MIKFKIKLFFAAMKSAAGILHDKEKTEALLQLVRQKAIRSLDKLTDLIDDLNALFRLVKAWNDSRYSDISKKAIVSAMASLLYFLNPFDFIPDVIPFSGFLDDAAVITYVIASLKSEIERFLVWENSRGKNTFLKSKYHKRQ